jgi:hypothetical protein
MKKEKLILILVMLMIPGVVYSQDTTDYDRDNYIPEDINRIYFRNVDGRIDSLAIDEIIFKYEIRQGVVLEVVNHYGSKSGAILFLEKGKTDSLDVLIKQVDEPFMTSISLTELEDIKILQVNSAYGGMGVIERYVDYYLLNTDELELTLLDYESVVISIAADCDFCVKDYLNLVKSCNLVYLKNVLTLKCQTYIDGIRFDSERVIYEK